MISPRTKSCRSAIVFAISAIAATPATAQVTAASPPASCELHVWPAERMSSQTTGWLGGGLIDADMHSAVDASNKSQLTNALDSVTQVDALLAMNPATLLGLSPGTVVVRHEAPLDRKTVNKIKTRRSDSTAQCYAELIAEDVSYVKTAIFGRALSTTFATRLFKSDGKLGPHYTSMGTNGLKLFPPMPGEDTTAAVDEPLTVFKKNFAKYAERARPVVAVPPPASR